jgi:hypothetical protein
LSFTAQSATEEKCATSVQPEVAASVERQEISTPALLLKGGTSLADINHRKNTINSKRRRYGTGN